MATITKLHASPPYRSALGLQYSVATFAAMQVLSCLHSPGLRCSRYNVIQVCCHLEAHIFVTIIRTSTVYFFTDAELRTVANTSWNTTFRYLQAQNKIYYH
jgi:hypothetical protein